MGDKIYLIEGCNFIDYPIGGQLIFCKQLLTVFPSNYFKLIGISTDPSENIGVWQKKKINDKIYDFFPVLYTKKKIGKGLIPNRLIFLLAIYKYRKKIFRKDNHYRLFTHAAETLLAINLNKFNIKILHFLHGVENPLNISRFKWAKYFSKIFWKLYLLKLKKVDYLAATTDKSNLYKFMTENKFLKKIESFPTRFDDNVFKPLGIDKFGIPTFVYTGRINFAKGWEFLIDSFNYYLNNYGEAKLILIGDGEDRINAENKVKNLGIQKNIYFTGFLNKEDIVVYLNRSHVFVLPSFIEGWSISFVEALACGLPIVSTRVSGSDTMIKVGLNGYIVEERDVKKFSKAMHDALNLECPNKISISISRSYRLSTLKEDLENTFPEFFKSI